MELLERRTQLRELRLALERARRGSGTLVLVSGDAGIGKTRLLTSFAAEAAGSARVLVGSCDNLVTPRTLGPFRDMARDGSGSLHGVDPDDRDRFIDVLLTEMGFRERPAVVIVEDLHWADDASLDVVRYLARRVERLPALLVLSYREDELPDDHPFRRVIGVVAGPAVVHLELPGLSDEAVASAAEAIGLAPAPVVAAVGGNPFYLTEILAAPGHAVPPSVRHAVLLRLSTLPASCRSALQLLAVIPTGTELWLASALLEDLAVLEPAERRGMIVAAQGMLRFRHELARRVVEEALPASTRATHSARVLGALVEAGAEPSRLVHHAVAAGDEQAAARYAALAAVEAARAESHRETAAFTALALERGGRLDRLEVARLEGLAAFALYVLNQFGSAAEHAERATRMWEESGSAPLELGEALLISARMHTLIGEPDQARAKALRALDILEPMGPSRALALCYSTLGSQDAVQSRFEAAAALSQRALDLAHRTGSRDVTARSLGYLGVARVALGDESGFAHLERAVDLAEDLDHGETLTVAAHNLAVVLIRSCRALEAEPYLDLAVDAARRHSLNAALFRLETQRCHVLMLRGKWDDAERTLRTLVAGTDDPRVNLANPLALLGRILARRGDPEAKELIDRAWTIAAATGEDQKMAVAAAARIEHRWLEDDPAAVRKMAAELLPLAERTSHRYLRGEVLRLLRRTGAAVEPVDDIPAPFAAGVKGHWQEAARLWERAGNPYQQALELTDAPDPAVVAQGLGILDGLGAVAAGNVVRRRLHRGGMRGLPRGPRATTKRNPGQLTNRQLEIVALLADGCTNAEIAARLYVSRRTVDNHVAAILVRLGISSRRDAPMAASRLGLSPAPGAET